MRKKELRTAAKRRRKTKLNTAFKKRKARAYRSSRLRKSSK
jgi:hypothetical protein